MVYMVNKNISEIYSDVKNYNYDNYVLTRGIRNIKSILYNNNDIRHEFENINNELMQLYYKLYISYGSYEANAFYQSVIIKGFFYDLNADLKFILNELNVNIDDIEPIGHGEMGYAFKINSNFVLKINCRFYNYNIPVFYRINDFIFRKKYGDLSMCVSPYAYTDDIEKYDVYSILSDFSANNFLLLDENVLNNIGIVDYVISENEKIYVDGVEYYDLAESKAFKKRKVKLIDQDFIKKTDF